MLNVMTYMPHNKEQQPLDMNRNAPNGDFLKSFVYIHEYGVWPA
jgi:hypothetical protein